MSSIKSQTDLLTSDLSSDAGVIANNIVVNATAGATQVKNSAGTVITPASSSNLISTNSQISQMAFAGASGNELSTSGIAPTLNSGGVSVKDITTANVNPATDEATLLWRRMVKIMESQAAVDATNSQRILVDGFGPGVVTGTGSSGDGVPLVTMASDMVASPAITGVTTPTTLVGWNDQRFQDIARDAYARSIRSNLIFS